LAHHGAVSIYNNGTQWLTIGILRARRIFIIHCSSMVYLYFNKMAWVTLFKDGVEFEIERIVYKL
jgi:hypothetical protein